MSSATDITELGFRDPYKLAAKKACWKSIAYFASNVTERTPTPRQLMISPIPNSPSNKEQSVRQKRCVSSPRKLKISSPHCQGSTSPDCTLYKCNVLSNYKLFITCTLLSLAFTSRSRSKTVLGLEKFCCTTLRNLMRLSFSLKRLCP